MSQNAANPHTDSGWPMRTRWPLQQRQSALDANATAGQLVSTTQAACGAAPRFEEQGLAWVAAVSLAQQLLFNAEIARIEAQHAALSAAATLTFASGQSG